jgi:hypothetical protein
MTLPQTVTLATGYLFSHPRKRKLRGEDHQLETFPLLGIAAMQSSKSWSRTFQPAVHYPQVANGFLAQRALPTLLAQLTC